MSDETTDLSSVASNVSDESELGSEADPIEDGYKKPAATPLWTPEPARQGAIGGEGVPGKDEDIDDDELDSNLQAILYDSAREPQVAISKRDSFFPSNDSSSDSSSEAGEKPAKNKCCVIL